MSSSGAVTSTSGGGGTNTGGRRASTYSIPAGSLPTVKAKLPNSATQPIRVAIFGDSLTAGVTPTGPSYSWVSKLRSLLLADGATDGGSGARPLRMTDSAQPAAEQTPVTARTGFAANDTYSISSSDAFVSTTANDSVTLQGVGTAVRVHYSRFNSGGRFTVSIDGGAAQNVDQVYPPSGTVWAPECVVFSGLSAGLHIVVLTNAGGRAIVAPTLNNASLLAGGSLTVGQAYDYALTEVATNGAESALSGVKTVTPTSGNQTAQVVVNNSVGATSVGTATVNLYRRINAGAWGLIKQVVLASGSFPVVTDDGTIAPGAAPTAPADGVDGVNKSVHVPGVDFYTPGAGVTFYNQGLSGSQTTDFFGTQVEGPGRSENNLRAQIALGLGTASGPVLTPTSEQLGKSGRAQDRSIDVAIFHYGTNDAQQNNSTDTTKIQAAVALFIRMARSAGADPIVVLPPMENMGNAMTAPATGPRDLAPLVKAAIQNVADAYGIAWFDFGAALGPVSGWQAKGYLPAGPSANPHLMPAGYDVLAQLLYAQVFSPTAAAALP